ncbi:MAG: polyphosphate kinase 2 family protein [Anaerolineales bacterium]|jgi:PPK2 family polyphosphate:nucleotide phosphotransferase
MDQYRVKLGSNVDLSQWDPNDTSLVDGGKDAAKDALDELNDLLEDLQELLYAENRQRVLVVLQAMDSGGKDGTIRHVFEGVNPQGVKVANFKVPNEEELEHDYLWRVHKRTPRKGEIVIFNRSHYEDVLVVRVHNLVPSQVWGKRYEHINHFERMLVDEGMTILKFYLHIDLKEQKERFQARLDNPNKQWKFRLGDLEERKLWPEYMRAYEAVLSKTSTDWAPWYIVPANRKWYRNFVVASVLVETLKGLDMQYPQPEEDLSGVVIE